MGETWCSIDILPYVRQEANRAAHSRFSYFCRSLPITTYDCHFRCQPGDGPTTCTSSDSCSSCSNSNDDYSGNRGCGSGSRSGRASGLSRGRGRGGW